MRAAADELAAALARADPAGAAAYREGLAAVHRRIDEVDREIAALLAGLPRRRFLVYHPAWGAFAAHYGLEQVAIERHGKEPSARELAARVDAARAEGVGTVFVQRGFAERPARVVAEELGARVVPLDPLARDWDDNLIAVARALRQELASPAAAAAEAEAAR
jgi:zinc transport system substrate-binding protein